MSIKATPETPHPTKSGKGWRTTDTEVTYCLILPANGPRNKLEALQERVADGRMSGAEAALALKEYVQGPIERWRSGQRQRTPSYWMRAMMELVLGAPGADIDWLQIVEHHDDNLAAPYHEDTFLV